MSNLTIGEEQLCWKNWIDCRDQQAGDILVKKYIPLVSYHVQRISVSLPKNVSRDDIRSLGMMGLFNALERFDPKRDLKFDTYASFRIRGAILDGLRKEDWLPRSARDKAKKIESAIEKLEQKYMRNLSPNEIASELNIPEDDVYAALNENFFANVLSMDENPQEQDDKEGTNFHIKDEKANLPEEHLLREELYVELAKVIETLNEKEQLVLQLFYKEELTLTEIGQVMSLSTSRISQIHSKTIYKLRNAMQDKKN
ncbi:FliA/WhiG family RNA polymerase sigma factor [Peribacillus butanolivorans]|uniref:FliA/WhiG family RNA polymerase sigma factor n=1 Tax=Peribacillus TaxID=2675229 RepID=UPI00191382FD|nr:MULTISPECIES: FliA/WhiG family RNA polymerase sigma factor [unclassified Peribacillus]MBK5445932.1 FliA/WhiG family RNA polymerase sigma factor [Peribacillus sp. TH24]WMX57319.1 FliA/WhiG family RNA polymerase sigma factor [Peribacillus sp. R9-11]